MKIDLHVHSSERSPCSHATEIELIRKAIAVGLDGFALTDHDMLVPVTHLEALNRQYAPFHIYTGIEVTLPSEEHIVVIGIHDSALENRDWSYETLWQFVRSHGGYMELAHPFRFHDYIDAPIDRFPPDAIEVYSPNTRPRFEERIRTLAQRLGIGLLGNSDSHTTETLGQYYNTLQETAAGDAELVRLLHQNHLTPWHKGED